MSRWLAAIKFGLVSLDKCDAAQYNNARSLDILRRCAVICRGIAGLLRFRDFVAGAC